MLTMLQNNALEALPGRKNDTVFISMRRKETNYILVVTNEFIHSAGRKYGIC